MRVIVGATQDPYVIGLSAALTAMGLNISMWFANKAAYDMFAEAKPDYVILSRHHMTTEIIEAVQEFKPKVIIYGVSVPPVLEEYTALVLIPDTVPKVVADNIDNKMILHKAANFAQFRRGNFAKTMACDVGHISMYDEGPTPEIIRQLGGMVPLLPYQFKVCGPTRIPCHNYLGTIQPNEIMPFLRSTKVYIDYNNTLMLDCAANKIFTICNNVNPLFPSFSDDTELAKLLSDFVDNEKARRNICKKAYKKVINEHTYFHRVMEMAELLGETEWVDLANQTYRQMRD